MNILIAGAWPYANGSLHIGHIASLLPGDILARYYRAKGDQVYYVSGSDCYGTPVAIRSKQEGKTPKEISDSYHEEFTSVFQKLGFSYDRYGKTSEDVHIQFVQNYHRKLYEQGYIEEKEVPQAFCSHCHTAVADRYVLGLCPHCDTPTRGDQCDHCHAVLEPENLLEPTCSVCQHPITFKTTKHLFLKLSAFEQELRHLVDSHPNWRKNATAFTNRYINEGLRDRAITRSLDWGIDVPKEGYKDKKIYIWAENVLGYLSQSYALCQAKDIDFHNLWGDGSRHYYVHGKDNIPFHTIILPALLLAHGEGYHLPDDIISCEYVTLEGAKISTSKNWAIWGKDLVDAYDPDSIRYFFAANAPEKRDIDFSWREFYNNHNGELLGAYGNFVNRNLAFIQKYFHGVIPAGVLTFKTQTDIYNLYTIVGEKIEAGEIKDALEEIFAFVRYANRYFDQEQPWKTRIENPQKCKDTLFTCVQIIANLGILLQPFLPFSSAKLIHWLSLREDWNIQYVVGGYQLPETSILFERLDPSIIDAERAKLPHTQIVTNCI